MANSSELQGRETGRPALEEPALRGMKRVAPWHDDGQPSWKEVAAQRCFPPGVAATPTRSKGSRWLPLTGVARRVLTLILTRPASVAANASEPSQANAMDEVPANRAGRRTATSRLLRRFTTEMSGGGSPRSTWRFPTRTTVPSGDAAATPGIADGSPGIVRTMRPLATSITRRLGSCPVQDPLTET